MNQAPNTHIGKFAFQSSPASSRTTTNTTMNNKCLSAAEEKNHVAIQHQIAIEQQLNNKFQTKNNKEQGQQQRGKAHLLRHASATLGSGNLRDVVRLPCGEEQNEWIAANIYDFFRQVSMLYGMVVDHCTDERCPRMTAGEQHEYFWSDSKGTLMEPCPANVYIDYLLSWVQEELDDENTFPSQIGQEQTITMNSLIF